MSDAEYRVDRVELVHELGAAREAAWEKWSHSGEQRFGEFLLVEMSVKNTAKKQRPCLPIEVGVVDKSGREFPASFPGTRVLSERGEGLLVKECYPDVIASGKVAFQVLRDSSPHVLVLGEGGGIALGDK